MGISWPKKRRILGTRVRRLDGPDKATGKAKYTYDINLDGLLHAQILRCPHAHAKLKTLDYSAAEKMPGVKAVHVIAKAGTELFYAGAEVLALAADTEEHAADALRAVKTDYDVLDHLVKEEDALKKDLNTAPPVGKDRRNVRPAGAGKAGDPDEGFKKADATVEGEYGAPTICHHCLEPHGLVARWEPGAGGLTVWCSTQAVAGTAQALAGHFSGREIEPGKKIELPPNKVKCITHYMGGGFGSKFGPDVQGIVAAELALKAKAPVKLMLDRAAEATTAGNRPSAYGKVKIAGTKDGKIVAYDSDTYGTPGVGMSPTVGPVPYVYHVPNNRRKHTVVRLNAGALRAMRAPGHPQACIFTDGPVEDLAAKLGLDPMEVRLKNLPAVRGDVYRKEIELAAKLSGWKEKWHPPGKGKDKGHLKHGIGMAVHTWGGQASPQPNECTVLIASDGSVTVRSSTQDLGTAQRTVNAIVTAEILGLRPKDIHVEIGDSYYGASSGSGGSTTCPSQAPATLIAATNARDDLFAKIAPRLDAKKEDLEIEEGKVKDRKSGKTYEWKKACARLGMNQAKGQGTWTFAMSQEEDNKGVSSSGVGGAQVAEVLVDPETGVVRCTHVVAVQDCGLIVNKLGCESQVAGGVIMAVNYALFEERIMDRNTGRQVNADMEWYKLAGINDIPRITVAMVDMPERGVIGIGEPPTISTHAAIGNAIFNALGVRVPHSPFSPDRVLAALGGKK